MARTGRPVHKIPRIRWDTYIRLDIASQVELLLADPMREKVKYGARSALIEMLLEEWLAKRRTDAAIAAAEG